MTQKYVVEKDWITASGLRAVVLNSRHRCGYVAVEEGHPAYGKGYEEQLDCITKEQVETAEIGLKGVILLLTAGCGADDDNSIRRSIDVIINVHGGVTYAGGNGKYPVEVEGLHWFGFDCGHYGDDEENGGQSLDYCMDQCESMAAQLKALEVKTSDTSL